MGKFSIQISGGALDVFDQSIEWNWKNIRFSDALRDQYTTDIEIPKTARNMELLGVSGLLDSQTQLYGTQIAPCVLCVNGEMVNIYLQVVSITEDRITVCLYERTLPIKDRDRIVGRIVEDDDNTIIAWNTNTLSAYPQWFKEYNYGMPFDPKYAMLHPVKPIGDIVSVIEAGIGVSMPSLPNNWYVMATRKTVCPQNQRQTLEGLHADGAFHITGGQHVTNDLSFSYAMTDTDRITFNRSCRVDISLWVSWKWHGNASGYIIPFLVTHWKAADGTSDTRVVNLRGDLYTNYIDTDSFGFDVEMDDRLIFGVVNGDEMDMVRCVADMRISGYDITDDDYGTEMDYVYRLPRLVVYNYASGGYYYWYFDTTQIDLGFHRRGEAGTKHKYVDTSWASFAWFGYWANLPELKVSEFLYGLSWLLGKRPVIENGMLRFDPTDTSAVLDNANITEVSPVTDLFGMKNYIRYDGEENPQSVTDIDNIWLESEKDLHKSPFGYIMNLGNFNGRAAQYSDPEYDPDCDGYSCDFEDVGFLVWWNVTQWGNMTVQSPYIRDIPLERMGLDRITQTMQVRIECRDDSVKDKDYVFVNGRKFLVAEGSTDLQTGKSEITALLVPTQ